MSAEIPSDAVKEKFPNYRCPSCGFNGKLDGTLKVFRDEAVFQGLEVKCPRCETVFYFELYC